MALENTKVSLQDSKDISQTHIENPSKKVNSFFINAVKLTSPRSIVEDLFLPLEICILFAFYTFLCPFKQTRNYNRSTNRIVITFESRKWYKVRMNSALI